MNEKKSKHQEAKEAAIAAMRAWMGYTGGSMREHGRLERAARKAVNMAVTKHLVSHAEIARYSHISRPFILEMIEDNDTLVEALAVEKMLMRKDEQVVRDLTVSAARGLLHAGRTKVEVAETLKISRPTLDAWLTKING